MVRGMRTALLAIVWGAALLAQDTKPDDKKKVEFRFTNAAARTVIDYLAKEAGCQVIYQSKPDFNIDASSGSPIEIAKAWDMVSSALAAKNFAMVRQGNLIKVVTLEEAKKMNWIIRVGADPDQVEDNDTVITQIVPLKHMNVNDFEKDLKGLFPKGSDPAKDQQNNAFILNAKSGEIKRFLVVLKLIDVPSLTSMKVKILELKNSSAVDMKKILDEMFKRDTGAQQQPMGGGGWWQFLGGGGGGGPRGPGGGDQKPGSGKALASETIKIIADERTNSVIVAAIEENIKMVEGIVTQLDGKSIGVSQMKLFKLRYSNAKEVADNVVALFKPEESAAQQFRRQQASMRWWDPNAQAMLESQSGQGVRAVADTRSNTVVITATDSQMKLVEQIVGELDKELTELLKIRIFPLKNAEATTLAQTLNNLLQKQTTQNTTQGGGQQVPPWARMMFGNRPGQQPSSQAEVAAADVIRIVPETRTNSILVTAIEENVKMVENLIKQLDSDVLDALKFKTYPLRFADAGEVATRITNMFQDPASSTNSAAQNATPQQRNFLQQLVRQPGGGDGTTAQPLSLKVIADSRTNSVIVAATDQQLKIVDQLVLELDRQVSDVLKIKIYTLKNADATEMSTVLNTMFRTSSSGQMLSGQARQTSSSPLTRTVDVTVDKRTNSMVVKANEDNLAIIDEVVKGLDTKPSESETTMIYRPKNINSLAIMQAIQGLQKGGVVPQQKTGGTALPRNQQQQNPQQQSQQNFGPNFGQQGMGQQPSGIRRLGPETPGRQDPSTQDDSLQQPPPQQPPLTGGVDVQADEDTNILIVRTNPRNLEAIQRIIEEMDRFRPQVLIRVLIAEVTLGKDTEFGVEGSWENQVTIGKSDPAQQKAATDFAMASGGFSYLLTGSNFKVNLRAFAEDGRLKVLATPRVLVLDNQMANITVGKLVPFITQSNTTANGNVINTVQYQEIGIILRVTPHVNPDGVVTMLIHPEVSDVASENESVTIQQGVTARTFNQNSADTTIAVKHGSTVILGGLIREFEDISNKKIPILGDIPLIGKLFGSEIHKKERRELMIFLTPNVVFNQQELEELTEIEKGKLKLLELKDVEVKGKEWRKGIKR